MAIPKHKRYLNLLIIFITLFVSSCEKGPGEGGSAKIGGKVIIEDYNFDFTILRDTYPAQDYDVYIIYGDEPYYGDKVATSYDGYFEFSYLREGSYTIFAYSKDKSFDYNTTSELVAIKREVTISSKKQEVIVDDIVVIK
ncbi:hypothetical protein [Carboxylicivirga sp. N1Y90]|uniref:hypothetical protein n=1 Tax=Carboxylicivirga fragile TaxID=3417571 RepID=UPI003D34E43E|nr:hypothetical protein [Marinilabiliaceae bacterium N1Y90]